MADLGIQTIKTSGLKPVLTAATAGGDTFTNNGNTFIHVKNAGASAVTVTFKALRKCSQGGLHDVVVSVPAAEERQIGPFQPGVYNDSTKKAKITYSAVASVTVGAISL